MTAEKEPKLPAAVTLGHRGGEQTAKRHGPKQFADMAVKAHREMKRKYGKGVYGLIRRGIPVKGKTKKQCEEMLNKINAEKKARTQ